MSGISKGIQDDFERDRFELDAEIVDPLWPRSVDPVLIGIIILAVGCLIVLALGTLAGPVVQFLINLWKG